MDKSDTGLWLLTSVLQFFLWIGKKFAIWKISRNFLLVNARFNRRMIGVLRIFLNFLKSLFEMLKDPLILLFFSVFQELFHIYFAFTSGWFSTCWGLPFFSKLSHLEKKKENPPFILQATQASPGCDLLLWVVGTLPHTYILHNICAKTASKKTGAKIVQWRFFLLGRPKVALISINMVYLIWYCSMAIYKGTTV